MNVVLIGYRGSGKTTVGRLLAARCGAEFVDTDEWIARGAGRSIAEIFVNEGETGFRLRESEAIRRAVSVAKRVISVGGGAVEDAGNRAVMRAYGHVVWLAANGSELWRRIQGDAATEANRPDLAGGGLAEIDEVLERRSPQYAQTAHSRVDVGDLSPADVVEQVLRLVSQS